MLYFAALLLLDVNARKPSKIWPDKVMARRALAGKYCTEWDDENYFRHRPDYGLSECGMQQFFQSYQTQPDVELLAFDLRRSGYLIV